MNAPTKAASLPELLVELWKQLGRRRQVQFVMLVVLMVIASFTEVLTLGLVLPFVMALASPEKLLLNPRLAPVLDLLGIGNSVTLVIALTAAFCLAGIAAGLLRSLLLWVTVRLTCNTGADISIAIYRRTLYQPYLVHVSRNTSEVAAGITIKTNHVISNVFGPVMTLVSSAIMLTAVAGTLLVVNPVMAASAFFGFGGLYAASGLVTRKKVARASERITQELNQAVRSLNEGLGGIRDVLLEGAQPTYCEEYHHSDFRMRQAQASLLFVSQFPRYMIEALGMVLIAVIACLLVLHQGGIVEALPEMGALALGAQRLLPVLQQAYAAWSGISGSQAQLRDTVELLKQPVPAEAFVQTKSALPMTQGIRLNNVGFRYSSDTPWILRRLDLFIRRGERIGFLGVTGSGKSTLLDVVMGLLPPTEGSVDVDGTPISSANLRAWQSGLAHVPQSIFLTDRSVAENIAFGQPKHLIDRERVKNAARRAQLAELIESWPKGYDTVVGERGIRLSGGQRQRIGIARALYKDAQVIVFDEATSALDYETEEAVMKAIEALQGSLTILVIAHRLSTLRMCDRIVEIGKQGILRTGTWDEVIGVSR